MLIWVLVLAIVQWTVAYTPLNPTNGYVYTVEAARGSAWPSCPYRFLSFSSSCDNVDLWNGAGENQHWTFVSTGDGDNSFYLKSACGYLSYPSDCSNTNTIDFWPENGINQKFRFIKGNNGQFDYYIEAVGRASCDHKYLSFPGPCTTSSSDKVDFWTGAGENQRFRLYPVASLTPAVQKPVTQWTCPDPFVWQSRGNTTDNGFHITCTGGGLHLGYSIDGSAFSFDGDALGGTPADWADISYPDSRWAPENYNSPDGKFNYLFFSDTQPKDEKHRIGYVVSRSGPKPNTYTEYSPSFLNLGMAAGGDIDGSIFEDPTNGRTYLIWKTDDNSVGSATTRIWLQELSFVQGAVTQVGPPKVVMDSTGLWWIDSWVSGGSLVEGPELIHYNGYYYLFFAAGKFCQDTYTEGVARSTSLWGPYEKMTAPLLTNGIVGVAVANNGQHTQLIGPGHATIFPIKTASARQYGSQQSGKGASGWKMIWHASIGENCNRQAFSSNLQFTADGWPYVEL
jgi:hypothetical protein